MIIRDSLTIEVKQEILSLFNSDECIVFPTETVYGLLAFYDNIVAQEKIFILKQRPREKNLQILLPDIAVIDEYFHFKLEPLAEKLAKEFFPGGLTLVVYDKEDNSYGFRVPNHKQLLDLLIYVNKPLVATSCNIHGNKDCTSFCQVKDLWGEHHLLPFIFDGGDCKYKMSSTVVEVKNHQINILREGIIPSNKILKFYS